MYEEEESTFHLPTETESVSSFATVSDVTEVATTKQPAQLTHSFSSQEKLSDQALFDELNAVSEAVLECRNRILSKIS